MKSYSELENIYTEKLNLPNNNFCQNCDAKIKHPLLPWWIGDKYYDQDKRILFVGKAHRGAPRDDEEPYYNPKKHEDYFWDKPWAFWAYTQEIAKSIFRVENPEENIAVTNLVKCTSAIENSNDKTSKICFDNCVNQNRVIQYEISALKPTHVIFYTWTFHRSLFDFTNFSNLTVLEEKTDKSHKIRCGKKKIGWWITKLESSWGQISSLVTSHPSRKKKVPFINSVASWINQTNT